MDYFVSDLHLNHAAILGFERYQFKDIKEHNETICKVLKENLRQNDTLYCLGDLGFLDDHMMNFIKELPCKKILIKGNHDKFSEKYYRVKMGFDEVYSHPIWHSKRLVLSHYPVPVSPGILNLHGHLHASTIDMKNYVNVNIHMLDYKLLSYKYVMDMIAKLEKDNNKFLEEWYAGHQQYSEEEQKRRTDLVFNEKGIAIAFSKKETSPVEEESK